ncbi:hypothetical protein BM74_32840 [Bacillus thuringiensis]|uniref:Uncharacterized protein n=1 Tax=Bacillus thuringiensis TaxID=1428 RepID=A0A437S9W5_BACTU|nr:hypothetical protein BM74_32840 [Bacillus thuringiensis]
MSETKDIFSDFATRVFLAWFFSEMLAVPHAHQLKDRHNINFCSFELKLPQQGIQLLNLNTPNKP